MILWFVFYREVGFIDGRNTTAGDGATETGAVCGQVRLAITCPGFGHGLGGDILGAGKADITHIMRG